MNAKLSPVRFSGWKSPVFQPVKANPALKAETASEDTFHTNRDAASSSPKNAQTAGRKISRRGLLGMMAAGVAASQVRKANAQAAQAADLALVLAIDISQSVNEERLKLQRDGYIAALKDPRFLEAVQSGMNGAIEIAVVEWENEAHTIVDWEVLETQADVNRLIDRLEQAPIRKGEFTGIGMALDHSHKLFQKVPLPAVRRVIDISGDGVSNHGHISLEEARQNAIDDGVTINGLPILGITKGIEKYYEDNVIGGPRNFLVVAKDYADIGQSLLRKLIFEIAGKQPDETSKPA